VSTRKARPAAVEPAPFERNRSPSLSIRSSASGKRWLAGFHAAVADDDHVMRQERRLLREFPAGASPWFAGELQPVLIELRWVIPETITRRSLRWWQQLLKIQRDACLRIPN